MNAPTTLIVAAARRQNASASLARWIATDQRGGNVARALLVCLALGGLGACSKAGTEPPQAGVIQPTTPIATVPAADTVLAAPSAAPNASAPAGRANSSLTRAEEANAMPLPGQNNDHSAPAIPASGAK